jgi:hypothetical protein
MLSGTRAVPAVHSVQFYDRHEALIERLRGIVVSGLDLGNSVLIVATAEHRHQLAHALEKFKSQVRDAEKERRFLMCDAEETLATFMVDNRPEREQFLYSLGRLFSEFDEDRALIVFGELVSVLWDAGNKVGALELEALWNDLLNRRVFHLHCAYPRGHVSNDEETGFAAICRHHSHVIGHSTGIRQPVKIA